MSTYLVKIQSPYELMELRNNTDHDAMQNVLIFQSLQCALIG